MAELPDDYEFTDAEYLDARRQLIGDEVAITIESHSYGYLNVDPKKGRVGWRHFRRMEDGRMRAVGFDPIDDAIDTLRASE